MKFNIQDLRLSLQVFALLGCYAARFIIYQCFITADWACGISRPIRRTFSPEKCDLNSTCVLCAEGKYYFQTYKYPYPHRVKTTMKIILVAVMMIFWVSMMNKLYYGC